MTDSEKVKTAQALKKVRSMIEEDWPAELERFAIMAKLHRAKFLALRKEGFSDAEALELAKVLW